MNIKERKKKYSGGKYLKNKIRKDKKKGDGDGDGDGDDDDG